VTVVVSGQAGTTGHGGHQHTPRPGSAAGRHLRPLSIAFGLTAAYMIVEVVAGLMSGSLALLSDAAWPTHGSCSRSF